MFSLSTTLLLPGEAINTYKTIGFIIDSDKTSVRHVAESDSGSCGNEKDGDFRANETDIHSLEELADIIRCKHANIMNEVNINMTEDAYVGLFVNKAKSQRRISQYYISTKILSVTNWSDFTYLHI